MRPTSTIFAARMTFPSLRAISKEFNVACLSSSGDGSVRLRRAFPFETAGLPLLAGQAIYAQNVVDGFQMTSAACHPGRISRGPSIWLEQVATHIIRIIVPLCGEELGHDRRDDKGKPSVFPLTVSPDPI